MMTIPGITLDGIVLSTILPIAHATVNVEQWMAASLAVRAALGRLLTLWASDDGHLSVNAAYATADGAFWLTLPLAADNPCYPDVSAVFLSAARMQRAAADLSGVHASGASDVRPWLNHGAWAADFFPLRAHSVQSHTPTDTVNYPFVSVVGEGVHEIAVGPVHAGIIEPGHFRFSVVGEKVLRLEERLGYTHKGVERRMTELDPLQAYRLAGRVSGDTTVGYAWAYCMALESATQTVVSPRANTLRAVMLERERVANHLGDLGAIANDVAFAFALAQFSRLRENWLRASARVYGHRLMMDGVVPGGVKNDLTPQQCDELIQLCHETEGEVRTLFGIYEAHAVLQDRFLTTGRVTPTLAAQLGLTGLSGRSSGQAHDLRSDHPFGPYADAACKVNRCVHLQGDVAARVAVRFDEVFESLRLIRLLLENLPLGESVVCVHLPDEPSRGAGWVEGWRGELWVALELTGAKCQNRITRCHLHDPSWHNWPALEHAIMGNIVPDFPVINKSFNLSYSGHDL
jgi:Ni,Fe-hydrogenase III large subunit/Ni,Fe-hydrogenase III component G